MINKIIDFSINNKFIIGLFTLAIIGVGIWSIRQVPIDAVPDITNNQVQIITQAPNLGTEEIEQFVTYPVELAMSNLPDVKEIRSISRFGLSVVTIVFDDEVGTYLPRQLVSEKLPEILEQIPEGFGKPTMGPISTGLGEIYQYTLEVEEAYKDKYNAIELRTIQDWIVKRQMAMVPGVVEVNAFGGKIKQYEVAIDPGELAAIGYTITDIFTALANNNQNTGGAYIEKNHQANFIRGEGLLKSISEIEQILVKNENNIPVKIKDIATVSIGNAVRYGALTKDGKGETVGGMILMLKGASSNDVIANVKERISQIQKSLPDGVIIKPFLDRSELIAKTTGTVTTNLLEGGLIVIFVLVLLLGNWRGGLIVASTIPLSLLFAFILMNVFGVWANLMSLGAIDFGIIVDGAVIIVESMVFLMASQLYKKKNLNPAERNKIASNSSKKMMNAAFFGQLIILIVFIPILALEGVEGKMFRPMALTFIFAMIGAMILCLTYVPMISALFLRASTTNKVSYGDKFVYWIEAKYQPLLTKSLQKGRLILGISVAFFLVAIFMFTRMGGEFIPQLDEGDIAFHAILKPGSSLTESIATTTKIEQIVKAKFPEVLSVISRIGVADVPTDPMPMDIADVFVILKEPSDWTSASSKADLVSKIKDEVSLVPGVNFEFTQPIEMRFNELLTGVREDVAIKLFGDDLDVLASKAEEIGKLIANIEGVADMKVEATTGQPQISINYNRNKLAQYGLHISDLNNTVETAFAGKKAGVIFEGEKRFDLVVRLNKLNRNEISDIKDLFVMLPSGSQIPLREVAEISYKPGPMQISRDNTNRRTYVGINIRDRDVKSVVEEIQGRLDAELQLPPGYYIRYGGAFENLERASNRLKTVVPIALLLIFVLIYFALKSIPQTLMIYVAIPMATIGGVFALWLRDMPFSISAGVGFIVLFGVAVLNGLVMVSGLNELKEEGVTNLNDRIIEGTKRRIRPIMLTAFTDVLGFLPMAISSGAGAEVQRPLATVVIGGLLTATFLTLFVLPILYHWVEKGVFKINFKTKSIRVSAVIVFFFTCLFGVQAQDSKVPQQELKLEEAVQLSKEYYPLLKQGLLEIFKENALKSTAVDLGTTAIFTGGEEIYDGVGVYTLVGVGQSNIDVFGIAPKRKLQAQHLQRAKNSYDLSLLQVEQQLKLAWVQAFQAKKNLELYTELDSIYANFSTAVTLNYELEIISKLEFMAAKSQVLQINNAKQTAKSEYHIALSKLNLWLPSEVYYGVANTFNASLEPEKTTLKNHPLFAALETDEKVAEAHLKVAQASSLPKFSLQGGVQRVQGQSGFYSYQAGVSVPFLSGSTKAQIKIARVDKEIAVSKANYEKKKLQSKYDQALENFKRWKSSWLFYNTEVLPLVKEQRAGALFAYRERAIDYTEFSQLMKETIELELAAQTAFKNYTKSLFQIQYYNQ
ncbi:CusA/CzcA family heavy metal efflux RND transporter [Cellulophaga sp. F20128]|uniref:CusA/CzcA family heavy metal efflux RND transporter n=1 Tax=Cellulophaga sp. F20128 TaxID=2926413 RepID=UPI001FF3EF58|nr:CusA/CzcA family heavy metal efflux RND transporter [Cellulophaga sp. F20128]MCK0156739.1 CusA/CzcA family heavy metal efflux RND transporter [Cellulophaga sp. F20128]